MDPMNLPDLPDLLDHLPEELVRLAVRYGLQTLLSWALRRRRNKSGGPRHRAR